MRDSLLASFILSVFILSLPSATSPVHASSSSIPLQLGYGLTTLTSVSSGTPVYTVGDTLWVMSNFSERALATLAPQNSTTPIQRLTLERNVPLPLHEFAPSDAEGVWSLRLTLNTGQVYHLPIRFVKPSVHRPTLGVSQYSLRNDNLVIGFDITSVDAYDQEACLATSRAENLAVVHLPKSVGVGDIEMRRSGSNITLSTDASFNSSFVFWLELHHPFSFNINSTAEFISTSLRAATTTPVLISSVGRSNTTLDWEAAPRVGRYEARAFFQTSSGLFVEQAKFLLPDQGTWLSLDSCQLLRVGSSSIGYLASLDGDPSTWPSSLHLMYRIFGVESTFVLPLKLNISKVTFITPRWNVPVDNPGITVLPDRNLQQYTLVNGSLYLIARSYPLQLRYGATPTKTTSSIIEVPRPYVVQNASLDAGKLLVHVLNQEAPSAGVQVRVSDSSNHTIVKITNITAYATFFIRGGSYNVTAVQGKASKTYQLTISDGQEKYLEVQLPTTSVLPQPLDSVQNVLMVTGVIGVILNILVWFVRPRLSR